MNPVPWGDGLTLDIADGDNTQDLELARSVAPLFRLSDDRARVLIAEVVDVVQGWREEATRWGLTRAAQERMAPAFRLACRD